ncbi:MULE domain-containing protein [Trichonephila clavipes]|nr:MULE domain-containing protein [Trichonephila clavipes]
MSLVWKYEPIIQFLWAKNVSASDIHDKIVEVHDGEAMSRQHVAKWGHSFQSGRQEVENRKFVTWKEENKTMSKYVRQRGCKTLQNGEIVMNYHCCRSGTYKPKVKGLRNLKSQGSAILGISFPAVIKDVREEITVDSGRKMLIERKDIHNIKRDFNINGYVKRHEMDAVSVKLWAEEMKNIGENCIVFFKEQGQSGNDYCLKDEDSE